MKNILNILVIAILAFSVLSCNNDDDAVSKFHPNGIKILTQQKLGIGNSTYTIDNGSLIAINSILPNISITGVEGTFFSFESENGSEILLKVEGEQIQGILYLIDSQDNVFIGQNLTVNDLNITGQLEAQTGNTTIEINLTIDDTQIGGGNSQIEVNGTNATLSGTLGSYTYNQILDINSMYPNVDKIIFTTIRGSANDDVNVNTGRLIREAGYATHLPSNGEIASGGVDLFTSGVIRTKETGATIGVHSWCCYNGLTAAQLPLNSPGHASQLAFFREMLGEQLGPDFYFFTIQAAPFDGIHNMTDEELTQYNIITQ